MPVKDNLHVARINLTGFKVRDGRIIQFPGEICQRNPPNSSPGVGSDSKDQFVRAEALMTFARSKEGHPRNNRGNLKRALFSAKKKRRLTRVNADHVPAYAKPFLLPVLREAKLTPRHFSQYPAVRTIDQFRQPKNRTTTPDATLVWMF